MATPSRKPEPTAPVPNPKVPSSQPAGLEASGPAEASSGPPPSECPNCGGLGWRIAPDGGAGSAVRCECRIERRRSDYLELAGIPERYRLCRLAKFDTRNPDKVVSQSLLRAKNISQKYVDSFFDVGANRFRRAGLLYIGPPGGGKTHLAVSVLRELIELYGVRGRFVDFTTLLHQIQATFHQQSTESKASILAPVIRADVLVLDELGAQKPTEWAMENLYLIMNTRYTAGRPTIFTTNYRLEPAGDRNKSDGAELLTNRISAALVSRLYEMAQALALEVPDYRRSVMMHRNRIGG